MHIGTFAGYARRLEETSSRTALVAVLAELFAAATPNDVVRTTPGGGDIIGNRGPATGTWRGRHHWACVAVQLVEEAGLVSFRDADKRPEDAATVAEII